MSKTKSTQRTVKSITRTTLVEYLNNIVGATAATVVYRSTSGLNKTRPQTENEPNPILTKAGKLAKRVPCPFGQIYKVVRINIMLNYIYENAVNNQRAREDNGKIFTSEPRAWGIRLQGTPFIWNEKNDKLHLEFKGTKVLSVTYYDENDNVLTPEQVEPYKAPKNGESDRQQLNTEIVNRDPAIDNILEITAFGGHYIIDRNDTTRATGSLLPPEMLRKATS